MAFLNSQLELTNATMIAGGSINVFVVNNQHFHAAGTNNGQLRPSRTTSTYQLEQVLRKLQERLNRLSVYSIEHPDLTAMLDEVLTITLPFICAEIGFRRATPVYRLRGIEGRILTEIRRMQGIIMTLLGALEETAPALLLWDLLSEVWHCLWPWICDRKKISEGTKQLSECHKTIKADLFTISQLCSGSRDPTRRITFLQIEISDFFGMIWSLPQDLCSRQEVFLQILAFKFEGGVAERIIASRRFIVFHKGKDQGGLELVKNDNWIETIEAGDPLQLSVMVGSQSQLAATVVGIRCPRCKSSRSTLHTDKRWADCTQCDSSFNIAPSGFGETADEFCSPLASESPRHHLAGAVEESEESIFKIFSVFQYHEISSALPDSNPLENGADESYPSSISDILEDDGYDIDESFTFPGQLESPFLPPNQCQEAVAGAGIQCRQCASSLTILCEDVQWCARCEASFESTPLQNVSIEKNPDLQESKDVVTTLPSSLKVKPKARNPSNQYSGFKHIKFEQSISISLHPENNESPSQALAKESLTPVFQRRKFGIPYTPKHNCHGLREMVGRCYNRPLSLVSVISEKLVAAGMVLGDTMDGSRFCDALLEVARSKGISYEPHLREGAIFINPKIAQIQERAEALDFSAKYLHEEFCWFKVGVLNIQKYLAVPAKNVKKRVFFAREDPEAFTRVLERIQYYIARILGNLGQINSLWQAQYLKKHAYSTHTQELSIKHLRTINHLRSIQKNFVGLKAYFQGYKDKMTNVHANYLNLLEATKESHLSNESIEAFQCL